MANVFDVVFHHHQTLYPHPPGKACVLVRVDAAFCQYVRMDHAAAKKLYPAGVTANITTLLFTKWTAQGKFKTRFSEGEIERLGLNFQFLPEIFLQKSFQGRNQMTGVYA